MRFLAGVVVALLAFSSWDWAWPACVAIGIAAFWSDLSAITHEVWIQREVSRLRRAATATLHLDCPADIAWRCFVGEE